jgi:hypothetical protein
VNGARHISDTVPFLRVVVQFGVYYFSVTARIDTGFDGDVVIPDTIHPADVQPIGRKPYRMANDAIEEAPYFDGQIFIDPFAPFDVRIVVLGSEVLIGMRALRHFTVTFDHGERVIIAP